MIKCKIKRGGMVAISAKGKTDDLIPETLVLIKQIYLHINRENPIAADKYRRAIIGTTLDPNSPVWEEE